MQKNHDLFDDLGDDIILLGLLRATLYFGMTILANFAPIQILLSSYESYY